MISYKYKFYQSKKLRTFDYMMAEAAFVWNHALALQKRFYALSKTLEWKRSYISFYDMCHHFAKRITRTRLASHTVREILMRQDNAFSMFFKKVKKRPPKFKRAKDFTSFAYDYCGYKLYGNELIITKTSKRFKFVLSRKWEGNVKWIRIIRSNGDWYLIVDTDAVPNTYGETHTGASIGIDFGMKTFMTLSNGIRIESPQFYRHSMNEIKKWGRLLSKSKKGSNHWYSYKRRLNQIYANLKNRRTDWFFKTAHTLCKNYEFVFIEDLNMAGMMRRKGWGRKISDLGWASFVSILEHISAKYGVTVHKIDRFYPSSRLCVCGYKNETLKLNDREWVCPSCGQIHDRDVNAAQNIYRRGIAELGSFGKTISECALNGTARYYPRISQITVESMSRPSEEQN